MIQILIKRRYPSHTLTDEEILGKVRKDINRVLNKMFYGTNIMVHYYSARCEGFLYGLFCSDRLTMEEYDQFSAVLDMMIIEYGSEESLR